MITVAVLATKFAQYSLTTKSGLQLLFNEY